eukprot:91390-Rhodomonas_salina.2
MPTRTVVDSEVYKCNDQSRFATASSKKDKTKRDDHQGRQHASTATFKFAALSQGRQVNRRRKRTHHRCRPARR